LTEEALGAKAAAEAGNNWAGGIEFVLIYENRTFRMTGEMNLEGGDGELARQVDRKHSKTFKKIRKK